MNNEVCSAILVFDLDGSFPAPLWISAVVVAVSYFLGDISPAILIGRLMGVDIRKEGSGNAGTTNVLRVLGAKAAAATLLIDILKGVAAVLLGRYIGGSETMAVICGLAAFCGHIWPLLFGFRGGKGIATGFGILLTVNPTIGLICLGVAAAAMLISQRVSVGSLLGAAAAVLLACHFQPNDVFWFFIMAAIVYIKHRGNIWRLLHGQEPKVNFKKKKTEADGDRKEEEE